MLTVHDMIPFIEKKSVSLSYYLQLSYLLPRVLSKVDHIVCVSEWTKNVLCDRYQGLEQKITVIPHGFDSFSFKGPGFSSEESKTLKLLYIARYEKYKRIDFLLEVVKRAAGKLSLDLITDSKGHYILSKTYAYLVADGTLRLWTGLSDVDMKHRFTAANVYVHTSLFEGYGLPVAEAMSFGLPVVYQGGSAVDEVVGPDGGFPLLGAQNSLDDWIDRIMEAHAAAGSPDFGLRLQKICESRCSWSESARKLISIYDRLAL